MILHWHPANLNNNNLLNEQATSMFIFAEVFEPQREEDILSQLLYFIFVYLINFGYIFTINMNFKSNFGNNLDYYAPQNNMGYSNVSRNYTRGISPRSIIIYTQMESINTEAAWEKSNLCSKMSAKSSDRPRIDLSQIQTTSVRSEFNSKTSSLG